jgi:hypothetical protein
VKSAVTAAHADGTLRHPARATVVYMMSSRQVLFSSPLPEGRRVGAWHPHLMIAMPNATEEQLGLGSGRRLVGRYRLPPAEASNTRARSYSG